MGHFVYPRHITIAVFLAVIAAACSRGVEQEQVQTVPLPEKYTQLEFSFGDVMAAQEADGLCPIRITFGSECCGVDLSLRQALDDVLVHEPTVRTVFVQAWGREGEFDYCVDVPDIADREPVLRQLQRASNTYGDPKRGYMNIVLSGK
jgi:hypothetical protein